MWGSRELSLLPDLDSSVVDSKILQALLTLILLTWRIWWAPNNASKLRMGFNSAVKGLIMLNRKNGDKGNKWKYQGLSQSWEQQAPYNLSVKQSDFTVWRHTGRKNWVICAVLTGNNTGLRTVLSSRLSHTENWAFHSGNPKVSSV